MDTWSVVMSAVCGCTLLYAAKHSNEGVTSAILIILKVCILLVTDILLCEVCCFKTAYENSDAYNKDHFLRTIASVVSLTPKFKAICDCRQRKFSQSVIQNKESHKVPQKPRWLARLLCIPGMVLKSKHEHMSKEGGYI